MSCTPGAQPCRRVGDAWFAPVSPEVAAAQLTLPITVIGVDGIARLTPTPAKVENGNVIVEGEDGRKHLTCELVQLAGGRVPHALTDACINDPAFTVSSNDGGWCYSTVPAVIGEACIAKGSPGTIRFFGAAEPQPEAQIFTVCSGGT